MTKLGKWIAPEPVLKTSHDVRKLRQCESCKELGMNLIVLAKSPKRGKPGRYTHGYCYAKAHGMRAFKELPCEALDKLTMSELQALGFGTRAGFDRYLHLVLKRREEEGRRRLSK